MNKVGIALFWFVIVVSLAIVAPHVWQSVREAYAWWSL